MKTTSLFAAGFMLILTGAGCLGGSSSSASAEGGVWGSADGGQTWTSMNVLPTSTAVSSINSADILSLTRDPSDANVLYAGTKANGLLYSFDAGATWQRPPAEDAFTLLRSGAILDVAVDSQSPCTFYVLKADRLIKTTTCGRSYSTEQYVESQTGVTLTALALDWYNPNNVWLGTSSGDVLHSSDAGANWSAVERTKDTVNSIIISNADSRIVLVATAYQSVFRTTDAGATWTQQKKDLASYTSASHAYDFAQTADGQTMVMSTQYGLFKSVDNGGTWQPMSLVTASGEVRIYAIGVAQTDGNTIMYGTDVTLYRSTNGGDAWMTEDLPSTRAPSVILFSPTDGSSLMIGLQTLTKN